MSSGSAKQIKKQALAAVSVEMNTRLDQIENYCKESLEKADKRARGIQTWIIQEVTGKIQQDLFNANCTIDAVVQVLAEAGINIENFADKVDAAKVVVAERKKQEAEDRMKAKLAEQQAAAQAQLAAEQPQASEPVEQKSE